MATGKDDRWFYVSRVNNDVIPGMLQVGNKNESRQIHELERFLYMQKTSLKYDCVGTSNGNLGVP